ncbi:type II toxin-antitoxin system YhaV family toxin [Halomonas vilamensis]|uniref:Type II toxin-antitoxin system YhaV family toxin n=1 Tax=Vreelandella vilamensis TaxID=531309 RepID=A0ABU1H7Q9_9GAMM|nr:type II toxin-antitoxin system YhaV family toxin [Halomonas vilamensis]MDR5900249.1 type II toxin-antitoxin system YhaV family toxin [Halomonas vilamensis]
MKPLEINGWTIYAHPLFLEQVDALTRKVKQLQKKDPLGYRSKPATKRLAAIVKLAKNDIPQDPSGLQYRQGNTLESEHTHWCRAKFYQQYQLFFRYDLASKILIYAWANDESTKRAYDSKQDAYATFRKMLKKGNPPDSWNDLWKASVSDGERIETRLEAKDDEP